MFLLYAIANPKNMDKLDAAIGEEFANYLANGPSLTELTDGQKAFVQSKKVQRSQDRMLLMEIVNNLNTGRTFAFQAEHERRVSAASSDDVRNALRKYLDPKKLIIIRAGDFKKDK